MALILVFHITPSLAARSYFREIPSGGNSVHYFYIHCSPTCLLPLAWQKLLLILYNALELSRHSATWSITCNLEYHYVQPLCIGLPMIALNFCILRLLGRVII